jgi:hypothetical protein
VPKGIDGGEMLAWAGAEKLLAYHLELGSDAKAFWKDGFVLYALWATGDFCGMVLHRRGSPVYPYTRAGFYQFLLEPLPRQRQAGGIYRVPVVQAIHLIRESSPTPRHAPHDHLGLGRDIGFGQPGAFRSLAPAFMGVCHC